MCQLVSWIEKDNKVYFLTKGKIWNTKRGKEYREYSQSPDDYPGHGAIRWFYNLKGGKEKECNDFSTPNNFPKKIVEAIKKGQMRGLGNSVALLTKTASNDYDAKFKLLSDDYDAKLKPLDNDYDAKHDNLFWDLFAIQENRNPLWRD